MMRKTSLILLGAAAGAAMTLLAVQPRIVFLGATAKAAAADTYRQLNLFGDVFERVRADYVEKPDDSKLIESAINGMLAGEPVAVMGNGSHIAAILATGSSQPVLYVEFRKDGVPVDPGPWWAAGEGEKVRG